jgi:hypothetical protein
MNQDLGPFDILRDAVFNTIKKVVIGFIVLYALIFIVVNFAVFLMKVSLIVLMFIALYFTGEIFYVVVEEVKKNLKRC